MKTIFITTILIFALCNISFAQQRTYRPMSQEDIEYAQIASAGRQSTQMALLLDLSDEQIETVFEIYFRFAMLRFEVTEEARAENRTDLRAILDDLDQQRDTEILTALNPAQTERFLEHQAEVQARREQMRQAVEDRRRTGDLQRDTADRSLIVPIFRDPE